MLGLPVYTGGEGEIIGVLPGNICLTIYGIELTLARSTNHCYYIYIFYFCMFQYLTKDNIRNINFTHCVLFLSSFALNCQLSIPVSRKNPRRGLDSIRGGDFLYSSKVSQGASHWWQLRDTN